VVLGIELRVLSAEPHSVFLLFVCFSVRALYCTTPVSTS
jgi:hypothetical protein